MASALFPDDSIAAVNYYTARIKALDDPGAPQRQLIYLRALATLPDLEVHFGNFQLTPKGRRLKQHPIEGSTQSACVILPEG